MRKLPALVFVLFCLLSLGIILHFSVSAQDSCPANSLFCDSFESDDFSKWNSAGSGWDITSTEMHSGTKKAAIDGNPDVSDSILLKSISGQFDRELEFCYS